MQEDTRADTIGCPWCDSFPGKGQAKPRPQSAVRRVSPGSRGAANLLVLRYVQDILAVLYHWWTFVMGTTSGHRSSLVRHWHAVIELGISTNFDVTVTTGYRLLWSCVRILNLRRQKWWWEQRARWPRRALSPMWRLPSSGKKLRWKYEYDGFSSHLVSILFIFHQDYRHKIFTNNCSGYHFLIYGNFLDKLLMIPPSRAHSPLKQNYSKDETNCLCN